MTLLNESCEGGRIQGHYFLRKIIPNDFHHKIPIFQLTLKIFIKNRQKISNLIDFFKTLKFFDKLTFDPFVTQMRLGKHPLKRNSYFWLWNFRRDLF